MAKDGFVIKHFCEQCDEAFGKPYYIPPGDGPKDVLAESKGRFHQHLTSTCKAGPFTRERATFFCKNSLTVDIFIAGGSESMTPIDVWGPESTAAELWAGVVRIYGVNDQGDAFDYPWFPDPTPEELEAARTSRPMGPPELSMGTSMGTKIGELASMKMAQMKEEINDEAYGADAGAGASSTRPSKRPRLAMTCSERELDDAIEFTKINRRLKSLPMTRGQIGDLLSTLGTRLRKRP